MDTVKITETGVEKLHSDWLSSLHAYTEHLQNMDSITRQLQSTVYDLHFQRDLHALRTELILQKNVVGELSHEIITRQQRSLHQEGNQLLTLADLIENNRLRDRILRTEKAVFILKYRVSKMLSLAS